VELKTSTAAGDAAKPIESEQDDDEEVKQALRHIMSTDY
jgi:hypothetical protein